MNLEDTQKRRAVRMARVYAKRGRVRSVATATVEWDAKYNKWKTKNL